MRVTPSRLLAGIVLGLTAAYLAGHVLAALYGIPPDAVLRAMFQAAGFGAGCVALLALALQLLRR